MESLLEKAKKFLDENFGYNEIELTDGSIKVRLVRYAPQYYHPAPVYPYGYSYTYQPAPLAP